MKEKEINKKGKQKAKKLPDITLQQDTNMKYKETDNDVTSGQMLAEFPTIAYEIKAKGFKYISGNSILNQATKKPESRMTSFEKISMIKEGISKRDLENLKDKAGLDYNQLSQVLSVARATLINKKGNDKFDTNLSEKIVGVADIYSYGYDVFEDETKFNRWVFRSNRSLGGQSPFDLLDNQYGREEVKNLIGRIDYGVYS